MRPRLRETSTIPIALSLLAVVLAASACGSRPAVALRHGTFEVRRDVTPSSLLHGVLGVRSGSSSSDVSHSFGEPWTKVSSTFHGRHHTCWAYRAHQPDSSLDGLSFCVNTAQRVDRIMVSYHG
jgi:hypothetical protein